MRIIEEILLEDCEDGDGNYNSNGGHEGHEEEMREHEGTAEGEVKDTAVVKRE
jgi:hypothetical protein